MTDYLKLFMQVKTWFVIKYCIWLGDQYTLKCTLKFNYVYCHRKWRGKTAFRTLLGILLICLQEGKKNTTYFCITFMFYWNKRFLAAICKHFPANNTLYMRIVFIPNKWKAKLDIIVTIFLLFKIGFWSAKDIFMC